MYSNIKNLCRLKKIPVSRMERDLGFARGYINKLKSVKPSIENVKKIATYLHVSIDELIKECK